MNREQSSQPARVPCGRVPLSEAQRYAGDTDSEDEAIAAPSFSHDVGAKATDHRTYAHVDDADKENSASYAFRTMGSTMPSTNENDPSLRYSIYGPYRVSLKTPQSRISRGEQSTQPTPASGWTREQQQLTYTPAIPEEPKPIHSSHAAEEGPQRVLSLYPAPKKPSPLTGAQLQETKPDSSAVLPSRIGPARVPVSAQCMSSDEDDEDEDDDNNRHSAYPSYDDDDGHPEASYLDGEALVDGSADLSCAAENKASSACGPSINTIYNHLRQPPPVLSTRNVTRTTPGSQNVEQPPAEQPRPLVPIAGAEQPPSSGRLLTLGGTSRTLSKSVSVSELLASMQMTKQDNKVVDYEKPPSEIHDFLKPRNVQEKSIQFRDNVAPGNSQRSGTSDRSRTEELRRQAASFGCLPKPAELPQQRHEYVRNAEIPNALDCDRKSSKVYGTRDILDPLQGYQRENDVQCPNPASLRAMASSSGLVVSSPPLSPFSKLKNLVINGKAYGLLKVIGKGGSSQVYKAINPDCDICAVKCVSFQGADASMIKGYQNEIRLLRKLQNHEEIVQLQDYMFDKSANMLYVVMECGDMDLHTFFRMKRSKSNLLRMLIRPFWIEMLNAVQVLHRQGIVHSDLKPANFILVCGQVKLIDFGIAKTVLPEQTSVMCDEIVGTFNYMSPEAITDLSSGQGLGGDSKPAVKISTKCDVWSLGCILYYLVYSQTPFENFRTQIGKLQAIINPNHRIEFPETDLAHVVDVLQKCLDRNPKNRPTIEELLEHPFVSKY